jgi:hypothetical protein
VESAPELVTVHVWGVSPSRTPAALLRMGADRRHLRRTPGLRFAQLLGTGGGRTFTLRDADVLHWALLATWSSPAAADAFESAPVARGWGLLARERLRVCLRPVSSRGSWSRQRPFGDPSPAPYDGVVAALTRARIRPHLWPRFWRAVPPVADDLHRCAGLRMAIGIGEAPVGVQGTFSLWSSAEALTDFAYGRAAHTAVVARTVTEGWYAEELFARFAVLSVEGTYQGRVP